MYKIRVLSLEDVKKVVELDKVIDSVKAVYEAKSKDKTVVWPTVFYEFNPGQADMDIRSGYLMEKHVFGHKTISFNTSNLDEGMPSLMGVINLFDSDTGRPIGIVDGGYITGLRTGAAGAIGAACFARKDSENLMILGAGNQATYQIAAALTLLPKIKCVRIVDTFDNENGRRFAANIRERLSAEFGIKCEGVEFDAFDDVREAVELSDIIITVTPSRTPVIRREWVKLGTHFSCIGADMEGKEEIDPELFKDAKVYVDDKPHCVEAGETEIPIKKGIISEASIVGEIGDFLTGKIGGRENDEEITIYDACGMALLDLATAKAALELSEKKNIGTMIEL